METKIPRVSIMYPNSILLFVVWIFLVSVILKNVIPNWSPSNGITLFAEIIVSIFITLMLLWTTKINEVKMSHKITSILDIVEQREINRIKNERLAHSEILTALKEANGMTDQILIDCQTYNDCKYLSEKISHKEQILLSCKRLEELSIKQFDDAGKMQAEFFPYGLLGTIKTISNVCKHKPKFSNNDTTINVDFCNYIEDMITPIIIELSNSLPNSESPPSHVDVKENLTFENHFSVSTDRSVYPLEGVIHVQINMPNPTQGKLIVFDIFNNKRTLLLTKTIMADPDNMTSHDSRIFEASFKMEGDDWRVGESYIARATHCGLYAEDAFGIDRRTPVVQTDKSVYMIGDDVILTVIDPDADKDSDLIDYVGDRNNSKLTIESKNGKISGYRLHETGNGTGIFQGVIRIIGVRQNGTIIPHNTGEKIIDKTQGTGNNDGYIGVRPGDEIIIRYQNDSKIIPVQCIVSKFYTLVELDKRFYKSNDTVHLTVIDPDHDYGIPDKIRNEITVNIKTRMDMLKDYKLVEIGSSAGVFTGKIRLKKCPDDQSKSIAENKLLKDTLCCCNEDFIQVDYMSFFGEVSTIRAGIRSRVDE